MAPCSPVRVPGGTRRLSPSPPVHLPSSKRRKVNELRAGSGQNSKVVQGPKQQGGGLSQDDPEATWLIVGLGNPGQNYEGTRHNIGFDVLDSFARAQDIELRKLEKSAVLGKGTLGRRQVLLAKPMTFMNNSGEAVSQLARFYKIPSTHILVVSDDLDLPPGTVKLRHRGGHGGQNGLRSIIERLGNTQEFPRLKVGIGRPTGPISPAAHVLQPFNAKERELMGVAVQEAVDVINLVMDQGLHKAMSRGGTPPTGQKKKGSDAAGEKKGGKEAVEKKPVGAGAETTTTNQQRQPTASGTPSQAQRPGAPSA